MELMGNSSRGAKEAWGWLTSAWICSKQSGLAQDGLEETDIELVHGSWKDREVEKSSFSQL